MQLEFRFAVSPTREFFSTLRLAALSLRRLGPPYDAARLVVSVGDYAELDGLRAAPPWREDLPVTWREVPHEAFRLWSYAATEAGRFSTTTDADVVILCDADVCLVNRVDDLIARLVGAHAVAGLQAHYTPFDVDVASHDEAWRQLFATAALPSPQMNIAYSNDPQSRPAFGPLYFNYGFVAFSRSAFNSIRLNYDHFLKISRDLSGNSRFQCQIGLALCMAASGAEIIQLGHAYNCANDDQPFQAAAAIRLGGVDEIRVIHFLRGEQIDRRAFVADRGVYQAFMHASGLSRVNARLRDHLHAIAWLADPVLP